MKFFKRRSVAGAKTFLDAVDSHCPPFVVVTFQPSLVEVIKLTVPRQVLWRQVAVVIKDRLVSRIIVIKPDGVGVGQEKVRMNKWCVGGHELRLIF